MSESKPEGKYISLSEAAKYSGCYSQEYLSLRARQGKLKAVKFGRNWLTTKQWLQEYLKRVQEFKNNRNNNKVNHVSVEQKVPEARKIEKIEKVEREEQAKQQLIKPSFTQPVSPRAVIVVVALVFILASIGSALAYPYYTPALKSITSGVKESVTEAATDIGEFIGEDFIIPVTGSLANIGDKFIRYVNQDIGVLKKLTEKLPQNIRSNFSRSAKFLTKTAQGIGNVIKNTAKKGGEIISSSFKKGYQFVTRPWSKEIVVEEKIIKEIIETVPEISREEIEDLRAQIQQLKEKGLSVKEITKEVSKVTQITPVKEITKEITKIDDKELKKLQSQISKIQTWEKDIKTLQTLTTKLQTHPPQTQVSTAPVYIGSQGLQVGGAGTFSSLVVSGPVGIANLGVGDSTSLGSDASDRLTVHATANFLSPTTFSSTLTVGDTSNYLTIGSTGDLTTTGNVVIGGDLTVTGAQTYSGAVSLTASSAVPAFQVNQTGSGPIVRFQDSGNTVFTLANKGALTLTSTSTPQLTIRYNALNYLTTAVSSTTNASTLTSTGALNLTANSASVWEIIDASLTIQTSTSTATTSHLYLFSASNLTQTFATTSIFTLYQGQTARLAIDSSGNISATGTTISLAGDTTLTGALQVTSTTTLPTTTITRLTVGATTSPNLFTVTGAGNAVFQNKGTLTFSPTSTLTLSSATTTTIGSATSTPLVFTSYLKSDIVSFADNQYSLGSPSYRWANLYTATTTIGNTIIIDTSTITATSTNLTLSTSPSSDIILTPGTGGKTGIGTTTPTTTLDIWGTQGAHLLNIASSTGESLFIIRDNGYVGIGTSSPSQVLSVIGNIVGTGGITLSSDIMPSAPKTGSIGSAAYDWQDIYAANVYADNIFASTSTLASTKAETFTINSDALNDATSTLRFYRGVDIPHALITWEAANDHFDFNFPVYLSGTASLTSASAMTIESASTLTVTSTNTFSLVVAGTERFNIDTSGNITLTGDTTITGTVTTTNELIVQATSTLSTTTITRLTVGATTSPNLFTVTGAGNAVFQNKGTLTFSPTSTLTLSSATTTTIGSATSTSLVITSYIKSDVIPYTDDQYDLGSPSYRWQDTYSVAGHFGGTIDITTNKIDASSALTIESGATTTVTSTGNIIFSIAGQERVRFDTSGRVGIGTTSPTTTLDIWGTQGTHLLNIASSTGESLLVVRDDGYVGIGTAEPATPLHVVGNARFYSDATNYVQISGRTFSANDNIGFSNNIFLDTRAILGQTGNILISGSGGETSINSGKLYVSSAGRVGIGTTSPTTYFAVATSSNTALFTVTDDGNVGIGTASPGSPLVIKTTGTGSASGIGFEDDGSAGVYQTITTDANNSLAFWGYSGGWGQHVTFEPGGSVGIGTTSPRSLLDVWGDVSFGTTTNASVPVMFIDSSTGRVGIGTSSPTTTLDVAGTITSQNILPALDAAYSLGSSSYRWANLYAVTTTIGGTIIIDSSTIAATSTDLTISTGPSSDIILTPGTAGRVGIGTTSPTTYFAIATSSNTALLTVTDDGSVGIGTATPQSVLMIKGGDETTALSNARANSTLWIEGYSGSTWGTAFGSYSGQIQYIQGMDQAQTAARWLTINPFGGNVGIGTTSPDYLLHSWGDSAFGTGTTPTLFIDANGGTGTGYVGIGTTTPRSLLDVWGDVSLGTTTDSSTPILFIDSSANRVGIGTTSPTTTLEIWGTQGTHPFNIASSTGQSLLVVRDDGNVGIGTSEPKYKLDILDASGPQLGLINIAGSVTTTFEVDAAGDLTISLTTSGEDIYLNQPDGSTGANLWICEGTACPNLSISGGGNLVVEGDIKLPDDQSVTFGSNSEASIKYDSSIDRLEFSGNTDQQFTNILANGSLEAWSAGTSSVPDGWTNSGLSAMNRTSTDRFHSYSAILTADTNTDFLYQDVSDYNDYQGIIITATAWVYQGSGSEAVKLEIDDGVGQTTITTTTNATWQQLKLTRTIDSAASQIRIKLYPATDGAGNTLFDGVMLNQGGLAPGFIERWATYAP